jgi:hypothetical protein
VGRQNNRNSSTTLSGILLSPSFHNSSVHLQLQSHNTSQVPQLEAHHFVLWLFTILPQKIGGYWKERLCFTGLSRYFQYPKYIWSWTNVLNKKVRDKGGKEEQRRKWERERESKWHYQQFPMPENLLILNITHPSSNGAHGRFICFLIHIKISILTSVAEMWPLPLLGTTTASSLGPNRRPHMGCP